MCSVLEGRAGDCQQNRQTTLLLKTGCFNPFQGSDVVVEGLNGAALIAEQGRAMPDTRHPTPEIRNPKPDTLHPTPDT